MPHAQPTPSDKDAARQLRSSAARAMLVGGAVLFAFAAVSAQLIRLAARGQSEAQLAVTAPLSTAFSRPDIVDRNGRLLATDVAAPSLFADPKNLPSVDETLEALSTYLPGIDTPAMRRNLGDKSRRFLWIKRRLSPALAEKIHNLGLPGLAFRNEPARTYPRGRLAGHLLGYVDIDNQGTSGIERYINDRAGVVRVPAARINTRPPVRLSIDAAAQYGLERELSDALERYRAVAATAVVMDVTTGEIAAAASVPGVDPAATAEVMDHARRNRLVGDAFEFGSVFKMVTIAAVLEAGIASPDTIVDVTTPLRVGKYTITDFHPSHRPLTVTEVFTKSSNVGAGRLALTLGPGRQRAFIEQLGLTEPLKTEAGTSVAPITPEHWGKAAHVTIAYGHGIAVTPLQFTAAAAALVNGGSWIAPTFLVRDADAFEWRRQVIRAETSRAIRTMMRQNVISGSGRRADVKGYRVGGKTGTADWAKDSGYDGKAVINSFLAAFPIDAPRYVVFVTLFDPKPQHGRHLRTASLNAVPTTARVIARLAPILGVVPKPD
jgi:cell division protein FtsI (penicillin-binding protein 3)